jgi:hypothetical protein
VAGARGQFGNPEDGVRLSVEVATRRLVKTVTGNNSSVCTRNSKV